MKITRILSLLLALVMIVALVGCGGKKRVPIKLTLSTEDAEAILAAAGIVLPDESEAKGANTVVTWYSNWDFHNYNEDEVINTGFFTFTEKYHCESEWIEFEWGERFTRLATLVLGGTSPDFMPAETDLFPMKAMKGMIQPVNDYMDYSDPLWAGMKDYAETYFSLGEKTYFIITDMSFGNVVPYNRRVMEEWGFADPAELYQNDEWTWDEFSEMCLDFTDGDADRYALDGWYFARALMHSSGVPTVEYDTETEKFVSNIDDPRLERAASMLYDLNKAETIYPWWNGWQTRNASANGGGVKEGDCLFWIVPPFGFTARVPEIEATWGSITDEEIMFVPLPRDPNGDGKYYIDAEPAGYAIIAGAEHPDSVALLGACDRFKTVNPTVTSIDRYQKEHTYLWTQEMLEMYDNCVDLANSGIGNVIITFGVDADSGYGSTVGSRIALFDDNAHSTTAAGAQTWAQLKADQGAVLQDGLDALNEKVENFIASGYKAEAAAGND